MTIDSPKSLPLDSAYVFAKARSLEEQVRKIENFRSEEISPKLCRIVKKGMLVSLFEETGNYSEFLKQCWPYGNTTDGQRRRARYVELADAYGSVDEVNHDVELEDEASEVEDARQAFDFALESHLSQFLSKENNLS